MRLYQLHKTLVVIPVFTFILSCLLTNVFGPYYLAGNIDPEYFELFNSLSIPTFHIPPNTDHPGTTLHVLGAAVIFVKWLSSAAFGPGWASLESSVLLHPEDYLHAINLVLNVLIGVSMYFAASAIYKRSGSRLSAIVLQLSFFLFTQTVFAQFRVSPEPLLVAVTFTLIILLAPIIFPVDPAAAPVSSRMAVACGALFGIGLVTKADFFPFGAVVLLFKGYKQKLWFVLTAIGCVLLFLLPSLPDLRQKAAWFGALVTHAGFYGTGPQGLPPPSVLRENARAIFGHEPYLCLLFACYTILLVAAYFDRRNRAKRDPRLEAPDRTLLAGWIAIVVQLVFVTQHFRPHYLLPALLFACLLNSIITFRLAAPGLARPAKTVLAAAGAVILCAGISHTAETASSWISQVRRNRADVQALADKAKTMPECKQIGYYRSSLPLYALHFGSEMSSNQQARQLAALFPESIFYAVHEGKFYSFSRADKTDYVTNMVRSGGCVLIQGQSLEGVEKFWPGNLRRDVVDVRAYEGLYRLAYSADPVPGLN